MGLALFIVFIVVPLIEIAVIIQVGQLIGGWWTLAALVGVSIVGAALVKREGLKAWRRFQEALSETRLPAAEVVDGALLLLGGALMLTPGFVTDAVGLLLVFPLSRGAVNQAVRSRGRRLIGLGPRQRGRAGGRQDSAQPAGEDVLDVEVVRVERTPREDHDGDDRRGDAPPGQLPPS